MPSKKTIGNGIKHHLLPLQCVFHLQGGGTGNFWLDPLVTVMLPCHVRVQRSLEKRRLGEAHALLGIEQVKEDERNVEPHYNMAHAGCYTTPRCEDDDMHSDVTIMCHIVACTYV